MSRKLKKQTKEINIPFCTLLHPKYEESYNLYRRFILLTGECTTRQATQEELDRFKTCIMTKTN